MKVSFNWVKELVKPGKSAQNVAEKLTLSGAEVEEVKKIKNDYIFDIDITPNRGDELSVLGIAREVAALFNKKLTIPEPQIEEQPLDLPLRVEIDNPLTCPRFTYRIIDNIEIKPSPDWIVEKLRSYGFRPINNIVDITNLVMIELGQPMHAFDYDKIHGARMKIRRAKSGERIKTLDGVTRYLIDEAIIIEDDKNIMDLAGIMGGEASEVDEKTKRIILEAAVFNPVLIRKTSKHIGLTTDASYRFERQIDKEGCIRALNRATELILDTFGGTPGQAVDICKDKISPKVIEIEIKKVKNLLGIEIDIKSAKNYLERVGFEIRGELTSKLKVMAPSWRNDIKIWQDVAEEIARINGYAKLEQEKLKKSKIDNEKTTYYQKELLKDVLYDLGFNEVYNYTFLSNKDVEVFRSDPLNLYEVENPVAPENRYLRDKLSPMMAKTIGKNPTFESIKIFEVGEVFSKTDKESIHLGIGIAGKEYEDINKLTEKINAALDFDLIWQISELNIEENERYKIKKKRAAVAEADLTLFLKQKPLKGALKSLQGTRYREISRFPSVTRDIAFIVDTSIDSTRVSASILAISPKVVQAELFDEFASPKFGEGKKNIAYHVQLQASDKTLTKKEADDLMKKITSAIKKEFGGEIRSF